MTDVQMTVRRPGPRVAVIDISGDVTGDSKPALEAAMLDRYRAASGDGDAFDAAYAVLGAQRNAKIVGIFTRLWKRDGKPRYPTLCPRVWGYLERDLSETVMESAELAYGGATHVAKPRKVAR